MTHVLRHFLDQNLIIWTCTTCVFSPCSVVNIWKMWTKPLEVAVWKQGHCVPAAELLLDAHIHSALYKLHLPGIQWLWCNHMTHLQCPVSLNQLINCTGVKRSNFLMVNTILNLKLFILIRFEQHNQTFYFCVLCTHIPVFFIQCFELLIVVASLYANTLHITSLHHHKKWWCNDVIKKRDYVAHPDYVLQQEIVT